MKHRQILLVSIMIAGATASVFAAEIPVGARPSITVNTSAEPVAAGKFQATWPSLRQYDVPEWFRDAKF